MKKVFRNAGWFFALLAAATAAWWIALAFEPSLRRYFEIDPSSPVAFIAFRLPDLVIVMPGSVTAAVLCFFQSRLASSAAWLVTGAISYATVYTFAAAMRTDAGWPGVAMMMAATLWCGVFATGITFGLSMFRPSALSSTRRTLAKAYIQITVVWTLILILVPYLLTILEEKIGIERIDFAYQEAIASILFISISGLGILSAHSMSRWGHGTPLPLDHANNLVVAGPYAYVRNPMALSGIGQGLTVALFLGSPLVALYALTGSLIWQFIFRPLEEDDLASRFGAEYDAYRANVKCWIPRATPYQIDGNSDSSASSDSPLGKM
ncbi:MAG: methyltransferase family protein [Pyrinomonadaceae bacterium]